MTVFLYNDEILKNIPEACNDSRCPLHGIPMHAYLGKDVCSNCKYQAARIQAHEEWEASGTKLKISYEEYKALEAQGHKFF